MTKPKAAKTAPKSNGRHTEQDNAQPRPERAVKKHEYTIEKFRGVLQDFNLSPKGGIEGFVLHSEGQTVQVNVSPDVGFAVVRGIGQNVEATVAAEPPTAKHSKAEHAVFRLVTLTGADGKALIHADTGDGAIATVQGVVKRINYTRHGEANGVVLESGDFVYLKPAGMKRVALKVGDQVTAEGSAALMPLGQQVVEAETVNGSSIMPEETGGYRAHVAQNNAVTASRRASVGASRLSSSGWDGASLPRVRAFHRVALIPAWSDVRSPRMTKSHLRESERSSDCH